MLHWRPWMFIVICILLLSACVPARNSQAVDLPAAGLPAAACNPVPTLAQPASVVPDAPPAACPVTRPPAPLFIPPEPYSPAAPWDNFWYGGDSLWTVVPKSGVWYGLPLNPEGYTQKVLWWRKGYSWTAEPEPQLVVTGRRLDAPAPPLNVSKATNAFAEDIQSAMLVGVDFPALGCWEITGRYAGAEVSFVVWVAP